MAVKQGNRKKRGQHFSSWSSDAEGLHRLSDAEIKQLQQVLLGMYKDLKEVCDRHGIRLIAAGGTALGAVRHGGFIPWDDDMDLFMFREEYEQFRDFFESELGDKYYLLAPGSPQGANCFLPRVGKKGTTFLGMIDETAPYPSGIYIDINIIECAPRNRAHFAWKAFWANARRLISYSVYWNQYKSSSFREYMLSSSGANYYRMRMALGKLFSFRSAEAWFASFDRYVQGRKSDVLTVPSGTKKYGGERLEADKVIPLQTVKFEDTDINLFGDSDGYLTKLYGNYMEIPKEQDREHHMFLQLNFDKGK